MLLLRGQLFFYLKTKDMLGKKYSVALSNRKDMNELVKVICEKTGKNEEAMRDKFKIVKQADTKGVLELCKFLKLKFIMDPTSGTNMISVEIPFGKMVPEQENFEVGADVNESKETPSEEEAPSTNTQDDDGDPF